jgi:hypothetical protein
MNKPGFRTALAVLLAAALIAGGVLAPGLLLARQEKALRAASGTVAADSLTPYAKKTFPERVSALTGTLADAKPSAALLEGAREPLSSELSEREVREKASAFLQLLLQVVDGSLDTDRATAKKLAGSGDIVLRTLADDPSVSVRRISYGACAIDLDAETGVPVYLCLAGLEPRREDAVILWDAFFYAYIYLFSGQAAISPDYFADEIPGADGAVYTVDGNTQANQMFLRLRLQTDAYGLATRVEVWLLSSDAAKSDNSDASR